MNANVRFTQFARLNYKKWHHWLYCIHCFPHKVEILWEGHKIWKNLPPVLTKQMFLLSSVKTSGRFFQIFVAFSEKLDFMINLFSFFLDHFPPTFIHSCVVRFLVQLKTINEKYVYLTPLRCLSQKWVKWVDKFRFLKCL